MITVCYFGSLASGILMLTIGQRNPLFFAIAIACSYFSVAISRPPASSLLLEQHDTDIGSASSLIQATFLLTGSMGMLFVSYDWNNRITVIGIMTVVLGLIGLLLWLHAKKTCRVPKHFN